MKLCCEGPRFTSIQEDGCDKEARHSYLELRERLLSFKFGFNFVKAAVVCVILEGISGLEPSSVTAKPIYLKRMTLKLLSIYFDLCVDATGVVISFVFSALISTP